MRPLASDRCDAGPRRQNRPGTPGASKIPLKQYIDVDVHRVRLVDAEVEFVGPQRREQDERFIPGEAVDASPNGSEMIL